MIVTKPAELRKNQKEYFEKAYAGETVVVSRPRNENVAIISEQVYRKIMQERRLMLYYFKLKEAGVLEMNKKGLCENGYDVLDEGSYVAEDTDVFYSEENMSHLRAAIERLKEGKGQVHDLIDVE